jgi:YVTN family beta-propeller protein
MHDSSSSRRTVIILTVGICGLALGACEPQQIGGRRGDGGGNLDGGIEAGGPAPADAAMGPGPGQQPPASGQARRTPTHGSAVAVTADDKWAVTANRTAGRVTVFKMDFAGLTPATRTADVDVGVGSEPWAVVIGADDNTAYVILRRDQAVVRIRNLRAGPVVDATRAKTGSEPTGIAISPTGARLYVANWAEGTVSVINSETMAVTRTVDLNAALAASGMLGEKVLTRPALAHPRSLVVTNDGDADDSDEQLYVTEFFSQLRPGVTGDDSIFDVNRQGVVYPVATGSWEVGAPIVIAPVLDTGFLDSTGRRTGCFPNQLYAAALNSGRLYVTSVCESPRGPTVNPPGVTANIKTQVHAAIFVIDTQKNQEIPEQGLLLTREFEKMFVARGLLDDASRRIPLIPNDIMFAAGTTVGYISGYGSDAVYRIAYKPDGTLDQVGAMSQPYIDLKPAGGKVAPGELPVGIASANAGASRVSFAVSINESTRNLSVLSFGIQSTVAAVSATDPPAGQSDIDRNKGRKFFVTGLGRWSLNGQGWNSCESCHPDGMTDNVTWFFARGPRQTSSLDASYDPQNPLRRRVFNWTGIFDEVHDFELNTRGNSGGVGAIVHTPGPPAKASDRIIFDGTAATAPQQSTATPQAGLNGAAASLMPIPNPAPGVAMSALRDWDDIDTYVRTIRSPRAPTNLAAEDVAEGKKLFEANRCAACHGGSHWTASQLFYTPGEDNNGAQGLLRTTRYTLPANFPVTLNPPAAAAGAGGRATLRFSASTDPAVIAGNDQINCVLRDVGTYPAGGVAGVAASGLLVKEVRQDMTTPAQGLTGFNIPSLLGMVTGAPYFHAGGARTLEEALGETFARHRRALSENFSPSALDLQQLTAFLLSIDEDAPPVPPPSVQQLGFPYDLCQQTVAGVIR